MLTEDAKLYIVNRKNINTNFIELYVALFIVYIATTGLAPGSPNPVRARPQL